MTTSAPRPKIARRGPRRLAGALTVLAGGVAAAYVLANPAGGANPSFSLSASPRTKTVQAGEAARYEIAVDRRRDFQGRVKLRVLNPSRLPSGSTANWRLSDGTRSNVVPPNEGRAILTIQTTPSTKPTSPRRLVIVGRSASGRARVTGGTISDPARSAKFEFRASRGADSHGYECRLVRAKAPHVPDFRRCTSPRTYRNLMPGRYAFEVRTAGADHPASSRVFWIHSHCGGTHTCVTELSGQQGHFTEVEIAVAGGSKKPFVIAGDLATRLYPGVSEPLDLTLTNPGTSDLTITDIAVSAHTSQAGCSDENFAATQMPSAVYPITLAAGQSASLTDLGISETDQPQVAMLETATNQDACQNAPLVLDYTGSATG